MIDHLSIQCADVAASAGLLRRGPAPLGGARIMDFGQVIGYGVPPMPDFWIGPRATGDGFREAHIAFAAPDRAAVRAFFEAAHSGPAPRSCTSHACGPSTTRPTTERSCATPTATTSRPSATRPSRPRSSVRGDGQRAGGLHQSDHVGGAAPRQRDAGAAVAVAVHHGATAAALGVEAHGRAGRAQPHLVAHDARPGPAPGRGRSPAPRCPPRCAGRRSGDRRPPRRCRPPRRRRPAGTT